MVQKMSGKKSVKLMMSFIVLSVLLVMSIGVVSAYSWKCLGGGETIPKPDGTLFTCDKTKCTLCVDDEGFSSLFSRCSGSPRCQPGSGGTVDVTPPELTIVSPIENQVYSTGSILFDIRSNEQASLSYIDTVFGRNKWKRLSGLTRSYSRAVRFKDGRQEISIKGVDKKGNPTTVVKTFFVDSKKPRITFTGPKKGFANGVFAVEFTENNPSELILHYGTSANMKESAFDLENHCTITIRGGLCSKQISLDAFDGQTINYWFSLQDIAGNTVSSKPLSVSVDGTQPIITNENFWTLEGNKLMIDMAITESNFDGVYYIDSTDRRPKEKRVCSKLKSGKCTTKINFKNGHHEVTFTVKDKAGNNVVVPVSFDVL